MTDTSVRPRRRSAVNSRHWPRRNFQRIIAHRSLSVEPNDSIQLDRQLRTSYITPSNYHQRTVQLPEKYLDRIRYYFFTVKKQPYSYQLKEPHTVKIMNVHGHTKNVPVWLTLLTEKINVGAETAWKINTVMSWWQISYFLQLKVYHID